MSAEMPNLRQVQGYCSLCIARCGSVATVKDGSFTRLDPDPSHPTGAAVRQGPRGSGTGLQQGQAEAMPLRRTRPKGDADPGWVEISWEQALDEIGGGIAPNRQGAWTGGGRLRSVRRLRHRDCGFRRLRAPADACVGHAEHGLRSRHVRLGARFRHPLRLRRTAAVRTGSAGGAMADIENAGCMILWGYNPSSTA